MSIWSEHLESGLAAEQLKQVDGELNQDPPMCTSCPFDVIHVVKDPRPSPFFTELLLLCIVVNTTKNEA